MSGSGKRKIGVSRLRLNYNRRSKRALSPKNGRRRQKKNSFARWNCGAKPIWHEPPPSKPELRQKPLRQRLAPRWSLNCRRESRLTRRSPLLNQKRKWRSLPETRLSGNAPRQPSSSTKRKSAIGRPRANYKRSPKRAPRQSSGQDNSKWNSTTAWMRDARPVLPEPTLKLKHAKKLKRVLHRSRRKLMPSRSPESLGSGLRLNGRLVSKPRKPWLRPK